MKTRTYTVYKYDELPYDAKEKALKRYGNINVDFDWWIDTWRDGAESIGLKIEEFDIYHGTIKGYLLADGLDVIKDIKYMHGERTATYKIAVDYEERLKDCEDLNKIEKLEDELKYDLLQEYLRKLKKEYEYLTSREALEDTFLSNEYDFTLDGKIDREK